MQFTTSNGYTDTQPLPEQKMANHPKIPLTHFIPEHDIIQHGILQLV